MRSAVVALLVLVLLVAFACSGAHSDGGSPGAEPAPSQCLERPGQLPRAPDGRLPCELIPPGLTL